MVKVVFVHACDAWTKGKTALAFEGLRGPANALTAMMGSIGLLANWETSE